MYRGVCGRELHRDEWTCVHVDRCEKACVCIGVGIGSIGGVGGWGWGWGVCGEIGV